MLVVGIMDDMSWMRKGMVVMVLVDVLCWWVLGWNEVGFVRGGVLFSCKLIYCCWVSNCGVLLEWICFVCGSGRVCLDNIEFGGIYFIKIKYSELVNNMSCSLLRFVYF